MAVQMKSPTTDDMFHTWLHMVNEACAKLSVPTKVRFGSRW